MKRKTLFLTMALAACISVASAQSSDKYVTLRSVEKGKKGNTVNIDFDVDYDRLRLTRQEELIVTPVIVSGRDSIALESVVFAGRKRAKVERRRARFYPGYDLGYDEAQVTMLVNRHSQQRVKNTDTNADIVFDNVIPYEYTTAYQPWMRGSHVVLKQELRGCNNSGYTRYSDMGSLYDPVSPRLVYLVPQPAPERRSETMTARIIFRQDKYDVRRDLGDNATELNRMYDMTERIKDDSANTVRNINLHGVASPEGRYGYNERLAMNRATAVKDHLRDKYGLDDRLFEVTVTPEDWDSVRVWVAGSDLRHRNDVVRIIDETADPDARDAKIRALDGGTTYMEIYNRLYPKLRRVEYTIDYEIAPMPLDEARRMISSDPSSMSVQEMYVVLASYPADSAEAQRTLDTIIRYYPDDVVANNNIAARALERGDRETARRHLERVSQRTEAMNNLGVLYNLEGRYDDAERSFRQAAGSGNAEASYNLRNFDLLE